MSKKPLTVPSGYVLIFRPYFTRNGVRIYAKRYGKRVWPLLIRRTK